MGAEAKIYLNKNIILKQRIPKSYRHPQLDTQIRTRRTKSESKILTKALALGINVPKLIHPTTDNRQPTTEDKFEIHLEFIEGDRLSQTLNNYPEKKQFQTMQALGTQVALLHKNNIIHGDLTTSNVILTTRNSETPNTETPKINRVYLIDFGLSFISTKIEDKAVDLHLIKQALEAKHFRSPDHLLGRSPDHLLGQNHEDLFKEFCKTYKWEKSNEILERLIAVEKRGRYKH